MCGRGLIVWIFAAVVAGFARSTQSYSLLLLARMLSGVGEAGFVTVGGPFIQDAGGVGLGSVKKPDVCQSVKPAPPPPYLGCVLPVALGALLGDAAEQLSKIGLH